MWSLSDTHCQHALQAVLMHDVVHGQSLRCNLPFFAAHASTLGRGMYMLTVALASHFFTQTSIAVKNKAIGPFGAGSGRGCHHGRAALQLQLRSLSFNHLARRLILYPLQSQNLPNSSGTHTHLNCSICTLCFAKGHWQHRGCHKLHMPTISMICYCQGAPHADSCQCKPVSAAPSWAIQDITA